MASSQIFYTLHMEELVKIEDAIKQYRKLQIELQTLEMDIKDYFLKYDDPVKGLAEYIKFMQYPTEIYNCFSTDAGDYDTFGDVVMKVQYFYEYIDVVGLSDKDFEKLRNLL